MKLLVFIAESDECNLLFYYTCVISAQVGNNMGKKFDNTKNCTVT